MRTRIKICGFTRADDALYAAQNGVDAVGLVFHRNSPRVVTTEQAQIIVNALPAFVTSVAVFADAKADEVNQILAQVPIDLLQFHGDETPEFCRSFSKPYIRAFRMKPGADIYPETLLYDDARAFLLDAYHLQQQGGTGLTFDWSAIPSALKKPLILAGGLNRNNIAAAIVQVKPYAVDVSSGTEIQPGIKDLQKIKAFIQEVNRVDD